MINGGGWHRQISSGDKGCEMKRWRDRGGEKDRGRVESKGGGA